MPLQVPPSVSARRAAQLRAEDVRLRSAGAAARLGQEAEVLVEEITSGADEATATGTTGDYLRVRLDATGLSPGNLVRVRLGHETSGVLFAERV